MIRLRSLGECVIEVGDTRIGPQQQMVFAALLILCLERGRWVSRTRLIELLYGTDSESDTRHRLRQTLYKIKNWGVPLQLGADSALLAHERVLWDAQPLVLPRSNEVEDWSRLAGGFLPNYTPSNTLAREYLEGVRSRVDAQLRSALATRIVQSRRVGNWQAVEAAASTLRAIDPLNEEAHLALAESLARSGSKAGAINVIDRFLLEIESPGRDLTLPAVALRRRIGESTADFNEPVRREVPFVGRDQDLATLSQLFSRAREGTGCAVLLSGPPGIGKTRLLSEAQERARWERVRFRIVTCRPEECGRPFSAIRQLVVSLRELPGSIGCAPESVPWLERLSTTWDINAQPQSVEQTLADKQAVRGAVIDLIDAVADDTGIVIAVDDLHWIDDQSWRFLRDTVDLLASRPLVLLFASRSRRLPEVEGHPCEAPVIPLPMAPLTEADSEALLTRLLEFDDSDGRNGVPISQYVAIAEGNPMYISELAQHWQRTRDPSSIPSSITASLTSRLIALSPHNLFTLCAISVLGKHCTPPMLELVVESRGLDQWLAVQTLEDARLVKWHDHTVTASHHLVQDTAISLLGPAAIKLLHWRVADALSDSSDGSNPGARAWDICHHWQLAGNRERALESLIRCARQLLALGLAEDAALLFHRGRALATSVAELVQLHQLQILAHHAAGSFAKQLAVHKELSALCSPQAHSHSPAELCALNARWRQNHDITSLLKKAIECASAPEASEDHRLQATRWALVFADNCCAVSSAEAVYLSAQSLLASRANDDPLRNELAMLFHTNMGELDVGLRAARRLVEHRRKHGSPVDLVRALHHYSLPLHIAGQVTEAEDALLEAFDLAADLRLATSARAIADTLAGRYLNAGALDRAKSWLARARIWSAASEDFEGTRALAHIEARLALAEGDVTRANDLFAPSLRTILNDPIVRRRQDLMAYYARLALAVDPESITLAFCQEFERLHLIARSLAGQDGPTYALLLCCRMLNGHARARQLLNEYLSNYRRERTVPPSALQSATSLDVENLFNEPEVACALLGFAF